MKFQLFKSKSFKKSDIWSDRSDSSLKDPVSDPPAPWHFAAMGMFAVGGEGTAGRVSILMIVAAVRSRDTSQEKACICYFFIMGYRATIVCLQTEHLLWDLHERENYKLAKKTTIEICTICIPMPPPHTHTLYLITDSSCNVPYFHFWSLTNMKAFPIEVPDVNINPCRDKEETWVRYKYVWWTST